MAHNKQGKMANLVRAMLAFDKHMNLVLADTEEFRRVKRKAKTSGAPPPGSSSTPALVESEEKRTLGLTIVRGTHIISLSVEAPPAADPSARLGTSAPGGVGLAPPTLAAGPGISRPAGRGIPGGLSGPAIGVGGPPPPGGFPNFPPGGGFPGGPPPGFGGRGGPPPGFQPPAGFPGAPAGGPPGGFQPPPGFQAPPGQGRGFPPGFGR
ncbi:MAG: hypothetical protein M1825_000315 [Sarcosagium campestre]|nr:MAG: hypothetical protein M1825_000315 [Sarcosagium campestre]